MCFMNFDLTIEMKVMCLQNNSKLNAERNRRQMSQSSAFFELG